MPIYRKQWTDQTGTGWNYRLDIMPYGNLLNASVENLTGAAANLIEVGAITTAFDKLPYGVQSPAEMTIKMAISNLPSALQTAIRNKLGLVNDRNLFMLFSDRGTNGATYTLEFCGVQAKIGGTSYSKEAGAWLTSIELVDALYFTMTQMKMSDIENNSYAATTPYTVLYDIGFPSAERTDVYHSARAEDTGFTRDFFADTWNEVVGEVRTDISYWLSIYACRTSNTSGVVDIIADLTSDMANYWGNTVDMYQCSATYPRTATTALTGNTARMVSRIRKKDSNEVVGGMVSSRDKLSWARYETAWDWIKDLSETFNAKASYYPVYYAGGGHPYIAYAWRVAPVLKDPGTSGRTMPFEQALTWPEINETEEGIGKAETRTEANDKDVKQWVVNSGVARADKQFTAQLWMTNSPTVVDSFKFGNDRINGVKQAELFSKGIFQTNRITYESGGQIFKAHEDIRLYKSASTSTLYQAIDPSTSANLSEEPPTFSGDDGDIVALQKYQLWANAVQSYGCLPYALARNIVSIFGDDNITSFQIEYRITDFPTKVLNENLGAVYDFSASDVASELSHLQWDQGVVTAIEADHMKNTAKLTIMLVP
jgi:hypothetical protein